MASMEVLAHYDQSLLVELDCDGSTYGMGTILVHVYHDGTERPIAYASRSLSLTERNYN